MSLLLDTHALVWWWTDDKRLPHAARRAIAHRGNIVRVSAASALEIATKYRLGKWPEAGEVVDGFAALLRMSGFLPLPITLDHARDAGALASAHRDPFDRMLIAQAKCDGLTVVTADSVFRDHAVPVLWASGEPR